MMSSANDELAPAVFAGGVPQRKKGGPRKTQEEKRDNKRAYRITHRDEISAYKKAWDATHREARQASRVAHREERRAKGRAWHAVHREEELVRGKLYRVAHLEESRARAKAYHVAHREERKAYFVAHRGKNPKRARAARLKDKYGITMTEFAALLDSQGGGCAICGTTAWGYWGPQIDHSHITGEVRAILCKNCNMALGFMKDDLKNVRALRAYLEKFQVGSPED